MARLITFSVQVLHCFEFAVRLCLFCPGHWLISLIVTREWALVFCWRVILCLNSHHFCHFSAFAFLNSCDYIQSSIITIFQFHINAPTPINITSKMAIGNFIKGSVTKHAINNIRGKILMS